MPYTPSKVVPTVKVTHSSTRTISDSTVTVLSWDTEVFDTHGAHSTSVNTSRLNALYTGLYLLQANLRYQTPGSATGGCHAGWRLNGAGASDLNIAAIPNSASTALLMVNAAIPIQLTAGDYVEVWAYQNNGGNMTLESVDTFAALTYLGS